MTEEVKEKEIDQDIVNLVVARLEQMPPNISISVGGEGSFNADEMIKNVKENSEVGQTIVKMQLDYLRSLKDLSLEDE